MWQAPKFGQARYGSGSWSTGPVKLLTYRLVDAPWKSMELRRPCQGRLSIGQESQIAGITGLDIDFVQHRDEYRIGIDNQVIPDYFKQPFKVVDADGADLEFFNDGLKGLLDTLLGVKSNHVRKMLFG